MSYPIKTLVCAVTLTLVVVLTAVGNPPAAAATPQCGPHCVQVFSARYGTPAMPNFVESVFQGVPSAGVPTILRAPSNSDPSGDMIISAAGLVSSFFAAGMVSADVNNHYADERAVQIQFAPRGVPTGLCAAVATVAFQNEGLTLQPCHTPGNTVFVIDIADSRATAPTYFPIVIGNTTDFVNPFVMTIHGNPAHRPLPQITIQHLKHRPTGVPLNQLWGANILN